MCCKCVRVCVLKSYLDIREEHLEHVGGRVASVEEHELGLLQVVRRQPLLDLSIEEALRKGALLVCSQPGKLAAANRS